MTAELIHDANQSKDPGTVRRFETVLIGPQRNIGYLRKFDICIPVNQHDLRRYYDRKTISGHYDHPGYGVVPRNVG